MSSEYRIIYGVDEVVEWGHGYDSNITKKRWAGRWVYQIKGLGMTHSFTTLAEAKVYLKGVGHVMTRSVEELMGCAKDVSNLDFEYGLYVKTGIDVDFYSKQITHVRNRIKNRNNSVRSMGWSSELKKDLNWHNMMVNRLVDDIARVDRLFEKRKEIAIRSVIRRYHSRVSFIDSDVRRLSVEGWQDKEILKYGNKLFKIAV